MHNPQSTGETCNLAYYNAHSHTYALPCLGWYRMVKKTRAEFRKTSENEHGWRHAKFTTQFGIQTQYAPIDLIAGVGRKIVYSLIAERY